MFPGARETRETCRDYVQALCFFDSLHFKNVCFGMGFSCMQKHKLQWWTSNLLFSQNIDFLYNMGSLFPNLQTIFFHRLRILRIFEIMFFIKQLIVTALLFIV